MRDYQESVTTRQTDGQTDRRRTKSDPYVPLCFAGNPKNSVMKGNCFAHPNWYFSIEFRQNFNICMCRKGEAFSVSMLVDICKITTLSIFIVPICLPDQYADGAVYFW